MANYNLKYNKDDSVIRHIIVGLLADLNNQLSIYRQLDNDNREKIDIPFYYSISGDENFLKDNFLFTNLNGDDCQAEAPMHADGNYGYVPRGIVNLDSSSINPDNQTNKRNLGAFYALDDNGQVQDYVAEFKMVPVQLDCNVEIIVSSLLDMLKVFENIINNIYRTNYYDIEVGHLEDAVYRIPCQYQTPDDISQEKPVEFSSDEKKNYKLTFTLEVGSFIPVFHWETVRHAGNRMEQIGSYDNDKTDATKTPLLGDDISVKKNPNFDKDK